jgi:pimeloyl-ACP methyl ester carboxylesterase
VGLVAGTTCYSGSGELGSQYLIAIPSNWDGTLVLFGRSGTPIPITSATVLGNARALMSEGYAFAASNYVGAGLTAEAAHTIEELRQTFVAAFGRPRRTVVYGASFGGLAAARCMEMYGSTADGSRNYDGGFVGCGPLAGTLRLNYPRIDLRVVYQYYCNNHPRPSEAQYPLYLGLASGTTMSGPDLQQRVDECTGVLQPPAARTAEQQRRLANILSVIRLPENEFLANMNASTIGLRDIVQGKLGGRNPFPNLHVHYRGSDDDRALNAGVERYDSDPIAVAQLVALEEPTGRIIAPILTMHTIDDGRAFVEHEWEYRHTLQRAANAELLFQTYTNDGPHCSFTTAEWMAALSTLLQWLDTGTRPALQDVVSACERYRALTGGTCNFNSTFQPAPLVTRSYPRLP